MLIAIGLATAVWGPALQRRVARGRDDTTDDGPLAAIAHMLIFE